MSRKWNIGHITWLYEFLLGIGQQKATQPIEGTNNRPKNQLQHSLTWKSTNFGLLIAAQVTPKQPYH